MGSTEARGLCCGLFSSGAVQNTRGSGVRLAITVMMVLLLGACERAPAVHKLSGPTMGTVWNVTLTLPGDLGIGADALVADIEAELEAVNSSMSTYREDSEISRFNRSPVGQWTTVSPAFYTVLAAALDLGEKSDGAYDVTVGPLVNLWGFGPGEASVTPPAAEAIQATLADVGQNKLQADDSASAVRKSVNVYLDFSSIAKGYAVDRIAMRLGERGVADYLVEVGGEMRVAGKSPRGDAWRVAIEQPDPTQSGIARAIRLVDAAIATSGDYRNYFETDGVRYSHSIDPRTGYPVTHELVSVTVVHPSAMLADAWATALAVMGPDEALSVAEEQGLAVYLIERDDEAYASRHTQAFAPLLESPELAQP